MVNLNAENSPPVSVCGELCEVAVVEDLVDALEDHCGDVLAELRVALDHDKGRAAAARVGAPAVLGRLQREFLTP